MSGGENLTMTLELKANKMKQEYRITRAISTRAEEEIKAVVVILKPKISQR
jgi:hypothetical protein